MGAEVVGCWLVDGVGVGVVGVVGELGPLVGVPSVGVLGLGWGETLADGDLVGVARVVDRASREGVAVGVVTTATVGLAAGG